MSPSSSFRGAQRRSNPASFPVMQEGSLPGAGHRTCVRATRRSAVTDGTKKAPEPGAFFHYNRESLLRRRIGRRRTRGRVGFELLPGVLGALLQFFLQLLLGFLEHLRI